MKEKPFEILGIELQNDVNCESLKNNCIFTPFGRMKTSIYFDENEDNIILKETWQYFFSKFIGKIREEMSNGIKEILFIIESFTSFLKNKEMPVIASLSGTNSNDHFLIFSILEEFLNVLGQNITVILDNESMGVEVLNSSKILDHIWHQIKYKYLSTILEDSEYNTDSSKKLLVNDSFDILNENNSKNFCSKKQKNSNFLKRNKSLFKMKTNETASHLDSQFDIDYWKLEILKDRFMWLENEFNFSLKNKEKLDLKFLTKNKSIENSSSGFKILRNIYKMKRKHGNKLKPIILLIPNIESYHNFQIENLLELLSQITESYKIPFIIILGVSTNLIYIKQIIGQAVLKKLQLFSVKLLDSKKTFFSSILNQLMFNVDFIQEKKNFKNLENIFSEIQVNSTSFSSFNNLDEQYKLLLIPNVSSTNLKLIKDHFFQNNFSLTSAIRIVFVILQLNSTNNFKFLGEKYAIKPKKTLFKQNSENFTLNKDYDFLTSENSNQIKTKSKVFYLFNFYERKKKIINANFGIYIIDILMLEILNFFDINERYNHLINWIELIEKKSLKDLSYNIKNLKNNILNSNKNQLSIDLIFDKLNKISEIFVSNLNTEFNSNITSFSPNLDKWSIETLEGNFLKLFFSTEESEVNEMLNLNLKNQNSIYFEVSHEVKQTENYIEETIMPFHAFNTLKELNFENSENFITDYSIIYKIYEFSPEKKINLHRLFISFYNIISKFAKSGLIHNIKDREINKFFFIEKLKVNLSHKYKELIERFVKVINTFQFIGIIYLPYKSKSDNYLNKDLPIKNSYEETNFELEKKNNEEIFEYSHRLFGNIFAQKLYWDCNINSKKNLYQIRNKNEKLVSSIQVKETSKLPKLKEKNKRVNKLDLIKKRAAEINQKKLEEFRDNRKKKNASSINLVRELRNARRI